jgi:predicted nucleotidyltransferase
MGFTDPHIAPDVHARIEAELDAIARENGVRILLAVESGSRAWRFPSRDSDYDVRFIYQRKVEDYLAINPGRDVIERPIDAVLDINGWDLRKAMQLMLRSNAIFMEWLASPVRYRDIGHITAPLTALARETADLTALSYHYDHLGRRSFDEIRSSPDGVRLKTYFYALRPALALCWIREKHEAPPMDLPALMARLSLPEQLRQAIFMLLEMKASAQERDITERNNLLDGFISAVLSESVARSVQMDCADVSARADALFASIVLGRQAIIENPSS